MRLKMLARPHVLLLVGIAVLAACVVPDSRSGARHRWWAGLGAVIPHESFPAECELCHVGDEWNVLTDDFTFDHERETGVPLVGAHQNAHCLRCHNDRGPVADFTQQGCTGCHEDVHQGQLHQDCTSCHGQDDWHVFNAVALHNRTRFPLTGAHVNTACHKCHQGAEVGNFLPTDTECVTCHYTDLQRAANPPHLLLGYVNNCHRCHWSAAWVPAEVHN